MLSIAAPGVALAAEPFKVGTSTKHVRAGGQTKVWGSAPGKFVRFQTREDDRWKTIERDRPRGDGRFVLRARHDVPESVKTRVLSGGRTRSTGRLNVYRSALASWYGPGLYGNALGCGGTLGYGTVGVAHKSLPCGTKLTLKHGKHEVRARVIDRGPYSGAREFDLTEATARKLRFTGVGSILTTR